MTVEQVVEAELFTLGKYLEITQHDGQPEGFVALPLENYWAWQPVQLRIIGEVSGCPTIRATAEVCFKPESLVESGRID